ncbi:MAG: OB-fold domain-containing protein [Acidimicrobiales bacterium]
MPAAPPLPHLTPWNRYFWTSGAEGVLRIQQCRGCQRLLHPPLPRCPDCHSDDLTETIVSGCGIVEAVTVNHQPWHPAFVPPYVIAIVALAEDPAVRLTTNIVNCAPEDAVIGLPVRVLFEQRDDVWLPLFEPDPDTVPRQPLIDRPMVDSRDLATPPRELPHVRPLDKFESKVVISGIGLSAVGRRLGRNPLGLMVDACLAAIADAGLQVSDIDGLSSYPGPGFTLAGTTGGGVNTIEDVLRVRPIWFASGMEGAGQTGAVVNAMLAVAAGACRHVLCVRGVWESSFQDFQRRGEIRANPAGRISGEMEGRLPYGAFSAANWIAMMATRHMQAFGTTREQLGAIAVNARRNASLNPNAVYRQPITMDDYLGARMVSTPFGLFDCDAPCDGAVAVVVSSVDTIADLRAPLVGVEAVGTHLAERVSWDQGTLLHEPVLAGPARHVWTRTDLTHRDVDVAEIYDGFTFNCLSWIELLGFCGIGEGGAFVEGGGRIALDGELPLNTHGGQLSAGRLHGWGFLHEACVQLRGEGGDRQVAGDPEVAILSSGGGHPGGVMLLTRWR